MALDNPTYLFRLHQHRYARWGEVYASQHVAVAKASPLKLSIEAGDCLRE